MRTILELGDGFARASSDTQFKLTNTASSELRSIRKRSLGLSFGLFGFLFSSSLYAQVPNLGTAADFAVLAGSTVTNTGPSVLTGNLGVSPGSAITGFPPGVVNAPSSIHISDAIAIQAQKIGRAHV